MMHRDSQGAKPRDSGLTSLYNKKVNVKKQSVLEDSNTKDWLVRRGARVQTDEEEPYAEHFEQLFITIDRDNSGYVSIEEISDAFTHVGLDKPTLAALMELVTPTGREVSLEDFMKGMRTFIAKQSAKVSATIAGGKSEEEVFVQTMQRYAMMVAAYRRKLMMDTVINPSASADRNAVLEKAAAEVSAETAKLGGLVAFSRKEAQRNRTKVSWQQRARSTIEGSRRVMMAPPVELEGNNAKWSEGWLEDKRMEARGHVLMTLGEEHLDKVAVARARRASYRSNKSGRSTKSVKSAAGGRSAATSRRSSHHVDDDDLDDEVEPGMEDEAAEMAKVLAGLRPEEQQDALARLLRKSRAASQRSRGRSKSSQWETGSQDLDDFSDDLDDAAGDGWGNDAEARMLRKVAANLDTQRQSMGWDASVEELSKSALLAAPPPAPASPIHNRKSDAIKLAAIISSVVGGHVMSQFGGEGFKVDDEDEDHGKGRGRSTRTSAHPSRHPSRHGSRPDTAASRKSLGKNKSVRAAADRAPGALGSFHGGRPMLVISKSQKAMLMEALPMISYWSQSRHKYSNNELPPPPPAGLPQIGLQPPRRPPTPPDARKPGQRHGSPSSPSRADSPSRGRSPSPPGRSNPAAGTRGRAGLPLSTQASAAQGGLYSSRSNVAGGPSVPGHLSIYNSTAGGAAGQAAAGQSLFSLPSMMSVRSARYSAPMLPGYLSAHQITEIRARDAVGESVQDLLAGWPSSYSQVVVDGPAVTQQPSMAHTYSGERDLDDLRLFRPMSRYKHHVTTTIDEDSRRAALDKTERRAFLRDRALLHPGQLSQWVRREAYQQIRDAEAVCIQRRALGLHSDSESEYGYDNDEYGSEAREPLRDEPPAPASMIKPGRNTGGATVGFQLP